MKCPFHERFGLFSGLGALAAVRGRGERVFNMAYNDFSLDKVESLLGITLRMVDLFTPLTEALKP